MGKISCQNMKTLLEGSRRQINSLKVSAMSRAISTYTTEEG